MIEPEMAFYDLKDNMDLAEDFLKYLISMPSITAATISPS
jgi:aspartyl/asparaginyl-tRNA synthetase